MDKPKFRQGVGVAVRFVPDDVTDEELSQRSQDGLRPREKGAGFYEFGFVLDGAFVGLIELKAGDVDARIAAWHKAHPKPQAAQPADQ